jgi:hypothetical protein
MRWTGEQVEWPMAVAEERVWAIESLDWVQRYARETMTMQA